MKQEKFDEIINSRIEKTKQLLLVKGKEYIRNDDPLHNFNRAAEMNREHPTKSLHGMLTKHLVSYLDMLDDISKGKPIKGEYIDEKLGDIITYFHLAEACIVENYLKGNDITIDTSNKKITVTPPLASQAEIRFIVKNEIKPHTVEIVDFNKDQFIVKSVNHPNWYLHFPHFSFKNVYYELVEKKSASVFNDIKECEEFCKQKELIILKEEESDKLIRVIIQEGGSKKGKGFFIVDTNCTDLEKECLLVKKDSYEFVSQSEATVFSNKEQAKYYCSIHNLQII